LTTVQDVTDTGPEGYRFLKLDSGMTDILRPSLYGAQHPIDILQAAPSGQSEPVIIVGHCCESGDILTPAPGDPEGLSPRNLPSANIGDLALIGGAGAYCSSMSAKNYNSFPEVPEVILHPDQTFSLIRKRQTLEQVLQNEI
jgi:diaminopimelate decarboxylase